MLTCQYYVHHYITHHVVPFLQTCSDALTRKTVEKKVLSGTMPHDGITAEGPHSPSRPDTKSPPTAEVTPAPVPKSPPKIRSSSVQQDEDSFSMSPRTMGGWDDFVDVENKDQPWNQSPNDKHNHLMTQRSDPQEHRHQERELEVLEKQIAPSPKKKAKLENRLTLSTAKDRHAEEDCAANEDRSAAENHDAAEESFVETVVSESDNWEAYVQQLKHYQATGIILPLNIRGGGGQSVTPEEKIRDANTSTSNSAKHSQYFPENASPRPRHRGQGLRTLDRDDAGRSKAFNGLVPGTKIFFSGK